MNRYSLSKNVRFAVGEFVVNIALIFASYRVVIQVGGIEALGLWATLFAWTSLIRVGDIGMANAVLRFTVLHQAEDKQSTASTYVQTGIVANALFFAALAVIGYLLLSPWIGAIVGDTYAAEARSVLPIMFVGFLLSNISGVVLGAVQGLHLGYYKSTISVAGASIQLVAALLLVPMLGLAGLAWAQLVQYAIMAIAAWIVVRNSLGLSAPIPLGFSMKAFREMLGFSISVQFANVANGLFEPLSKLLVAHFGGLTMQGLYELAYKSIWLPRNAIVAAATAAIPSLTAHYQDRNPEVLRIYQRSVFLSTVLVAALTGAVVLATPLISLLWIGSIQPNYTVFAAILAVGVTLNAYGAAAYNLGVVLGRMHWNIVVNNAVLTGLAVFGCLAGLMLPNVGLVVVISMSMGIGGVAIKSLNESNLRAMFP